MRASRRHVDHDPLAAVAREHQRQARLRHEERPAHIHVPRLPPLPRIHLRRRLRRLHVPRVVDQHIQPAELVLHCPCSGADRRFVRHVQREPQHLRRCSAFAFGGGSADGALDVLQRPARARADRDARRASPCKRDGRGGADAPARASDEHELACEVPLRGVDRRVGVVVRGGCEELA